MYFKAHIQILNDVNDLNERNFTPTRTRVTKPHKFGGEYVDQLVEDGLLDQTPYAQRVGHRLFITEKGKAELAANRHRL